MRRVTFIVSLAVAVAVAAFVPAAAGAATTIGGPLCRPPEAGATTVQLTTADNGGRFCLEASQRLRVVLSVNPEQYPDPANWWSPVELSGTSLTRLPMTELPVRGTTLAAFRAAHRGSSVLSSTRNPCPPNSPVICGAPVYLWRVTIFVI